MRIALCLEYPISLRGGVSVLVETLAVELARTGYEIVLVSDDTPESLSASGISQFVQKHLPWRAAKPTRRQLQQLAQQLRSAEVDLVHFHCGGNFGFGNRFPFRTPAYFLDRMGVPCVSTSHLVVDLLTGYCGPSKPLWFKWLMLPLAWLGKMHQLSHVRAEIAVSDHDYYKLCRWHAPLRRRLMRIYHSRLRSADLDMPEKPRDKVILNVGHLAWRKGQAVLAEAFARVAQRHSDWRLELAGKDIDGGTTQRIRELQAQYQLGDRIILLGERADVTTLMLRSAIYVQPSFQEALGLALQEAMACGCAAVGSRIGGIPELIENERLGMLIEAGSVSRFADALEQLMEDAALRNRLGRAAAQSIRDRGMTVQSMVRHHTELYERLLRKN